MSEIPTPRTDEDIANNSGNAMSVSSGLARQLERELILAKNKLAHYEGRTNFECECGGQMTKLELANKKIKALEEDGQILSWCLSKEAIKYWDSFEGIMPFKDRQAIQAIRNAMEKGQ